MASERSDVGSVEMGDPKLSRDPSGGVIARLSIRSTVAWFQLLWACFAALPALKLALLGDSGPSHKHTSNLIGSTVFCSFAVWVGIQALVGILGRVEIGRKGDNGWIFEGIGRFGWHRSFSWSDVVAARLGRSIGMPSVRDPNLIEILFQTRSKVRFGTLLNNQQREFLLVAIHKNKA